MTSNRSGSNSSLEAEFFRFGLSFGLGKEVTGMAARNLPSDASMCFSMAGCGVHRLHFAVSVPTYPSGGRVSLEVRFC